MLTGWMLRLMEYAFEVFHRRDRKHEEAEALRRVCTVGNITDSQEDEVPCVFTGTAIDSENECTVVTVFWNGRKETAIVDRPKPKSSAIGLLPVLQVK